MQIQKGVRELESLGPWFPWLCLLKATEYPNYFQKCWVCLRVVEEGALGVAPLVDALRISQCAEILGTGSQAGCRLGAR